MLSLRQGKPLTVFDSYAGIGNCKTESVSPTRSTLHPSLSMIIRGPYISARFSLARCIATAARPMQLDPQTCNDSRTNAWLKRGGFSWKQHAWPSCSASCSAMAPDGRTEQSGHFNAKQPVYWTICAGTAKNFPWQFNQVNARDSRERQLSLWQAKGVA
ncbi:uncharacterized protein LOC116249126 [Nymphaea colorata]|nr:uncharacterized protein LOC116249126 [Nymphaea colorata]